MPGLTLPPFPDSVPTHPLLVVDYALIKAADSEEIEKLWKAATQLGFWYLKNHGVGEEVDKMFDMGPEAMDLPPEEKLKFEQGDNGQSFGFKGAGTTTSDEYGTRETVEYINVSKEDALVYPDVVHRTYPAVVNARMESTVTPFVRKSLEVLNTLLGVFEGKLDLPPGALLARHPTLEPSGSEARCIKSPPKPSLDADALASATPDVKDRVALGAHTDFGSLSFLHNRLGGLQVLPPGGAGWTYVRPLPGHAICNIGDTLTLFSAGLLRSNLHRVVPPPGAQASHVRWSVVFFSRPAFDVPLRALADESEVIKRALESLSPEDQKRFEPNCTAGEWYTRRVKLRRANVRKGPETFQAGGGMDSYYAA